MTYLLLALVPYTEQNLRLSFRPDKFFNDYEKISKKSSATLRYTYNRARRSGLIIVQQDNVTLSLKARQTVQPFIATQLSSGGQFMVIFDIPEDQANLRHALRSILKKLEFSQIQQSVWMSDKDHKQILRETIDTLDLSGYVELYEATRINV